MEVVDVGQSVKEKSSTCNPQMITHVPTKCFLVIWKSISVLNHMVWSCLQHLVPSMQPVNPAITCEYETIHVWTLKSSRKLESRSWGFHPPYMRNAVSQYYIWLLKTGTEVSQGLIPGREICLEGNVNLRGLPLKKCMRANHNIYTGVIIWVYTFVFWGPCQR